MLAEKWGDNLGVARLILHVGAGRTAAIDTFLKVAVQMAP